MAAARMTMAVAGTRLSAVSMRSETNVTKNGAHLSMAVPSVTSAAVSCSFLSLSLARRSGLNLNVSIIARAADLDYESVPAVEETVEVPTEVSTEVPTEESAPRSPSPEEGCKLYIGNLPWSCNSQRLAEVLQDVGEVELVEVIYDRDTGRSKGYAFATMSSNKDAQEAIAKLDGYEIEGRALKVNFPQSNREPRTNNFRGERPPRTEGGYGGGSRGSSSYNNPNKLFVGNLAWSVDDSSLGQLFSDYGNVLDAKVVQDRDSGRSRGFGFVTFEKASEVNEAIQKLDGADYDGRQLRVNLAGDKPQPPRSF